MGMIILAIFVESFIENKISFIENKSVDATLVEVTLKLVRFFSLNQTICI